MKEIKKEIKSFETMYVANDGTEFDSREECATYEKSAKGIIFARYNKLILGKTDEYALYYGSDEHEIDVVKPTCDRDRDTIMQVYLYIHGQSSEDSVKEQGDYIERAIKEDDVVFMDWSCDHDWCWIIGTRNSLKENIDKCVQDFTKDDVEQK